MNNPKTSVTDVVVGIVVIGLLIVFCGAVGVGGCAGYKAFHRAQARADAANSAAVERRKIDTIKAKAEQRFQESVGVRRAQDEIAKTLTPLYVQHEAIQAMRDSGAERIYIPSGEQGIPMVNDVGGDRVGGR